MRRHGLSRRRGIDCSCTSLDNLRGSLLTHHPRAFSSSFFRNEFNPQSTDRRPRRPDLQGPWSSFSDLWPNLSTSQEAQIATISTANQPNGSSSWPQRRRDRPLPMSPVMDPKKLKSARKFKTRKKLQRAAGLSPLQTKLKNNFFGRYASALTGGCRSS